MAEIIRAYGEQMPATRFLGKKYAGFGHWDAWFANGWFEELEACIGDELSKTWASAGGYVGLERRVKGELTEYWIGMFAPANTQAPQGFACLDFPPMRLGVCWIRGAEEEVHDTSGCLQALAQQGMTPLQDPSGATWSFENCLCPRYTTPDQEQRIILDYCYVIR